MDGQRRWLASSVPHRRDGGWARERLGGERRRRDSAGDSVVCEDEGPSSSFDPTDNQSVEV